MNLLNTLLAVSLMASAPAFAADLNLAPLTTVLVNGQKVLADAKNLTVYTFDPDQQGASTCYDDCARKWPPVLLEKGEVAAPLGLTTRTDGSRQVTFNGSPVYLFFKDKKAGDTKGDGLGGVWHIVTIQ